MIMENVSGVWSELIQKDYIKERILPDLKVIEDFKKYPNHKDINEIESFANARKDGNIVTLLN